jgi:hypothetical protein
MIPLTNSMAVETLKSAIRIRETIPMAAWTADDMIWYSEASLALSNLITKTVA